MQMDTVASGVEAPLNAEAMDIERGNTGSLSESNPLAAGPPSPLTGCYLLIIIGEPHSEEAKRVIVEQLKQGKLSCNPGRMLRKLCMENFVSAIFYPGK